VAAPIDIAVYKDSLIILAVAGFIVPLMHRFKINPVLGFLATGTLLGPHGLGALTMNYAWLDYISISQQEGLTLLGEMGIVFLMFLIGMELSLQRLVAMRRLVFGLGGLQVALCMAAISGVALFFGAGTNVAILTGAALALSSTAIVIELLARQKRLSSHTGRASFPVLLFQDLAVIPILFLVSVMSARGDQALLPGLASAFLQAALAIGIIVVIGRVLLRPLFRLVAGAQSTEMFVATTLLIVIAAAVFSAAAGVSMALGAFVAGLLIAETEYNRTIHTIIEPFKGLLLGIFFFNVGMQINPTVIAREPLLILGAVVALIVLKGIIIAPLVRTYGFPWAAALKTALLLGPAGEFVFVIISLAVAGKLIPNADASLILTVATLSMACIPLLGTIGTRISNRIASAMPLPAGADAPPQGLQARAIIVGFGRVGQLTAQMLDRHGVNYIALERDAKVVVKARKQHPHVYYGDAHNPALLRVCGIDSTQAVIITSHTPNDINETLRVVRQLRADIPVFSRARDGEHAKQLYRLGVSEAVPETIEASLQLSEAALVKLGVPEATVNESIHRLRDDFRRELQQAAATRDV
jgi:monovalent cation:H+ antiporter-2, CPA2 family